MISMQESNFEKIIPWFIVIDYITGFLFFRYQIQVPFSQIVKLIFVIFALIFLIILKLDTFNLIIISFLIFSLGSLTLYLNDMSYKIINDLLYYLKIFLFPISFYIFSNLKLDFDIFKKNVISVGLFLILSIYLSIIGFGTSSYSYGLGYMGYFIAANEISALYLLLCPIFLYVIIIYNFKKIIKIIFILLMISLGPLILTKTALLTSILSPLLFVFLLFLYSKNGTKFNRFYFRFVSFITIMVLGIIILFLRDFISIYHQVLNLVEKSGSITDFLFSGRNIRIFDSMQLFNNSTFYEKLFGFGFQNSISILQNYNAWGVTEIDFIDILISNGIIGVTFIYIFWFYIGIRVLSVNISKKSSLSVPLYISFLLLFINSFIAGHIVNSAILGIYLGYIVSVILRSRGSSLF